MRRTTTIALCGFAIGASAQMAAAADAVDFQLDWTPGGISAAYYLGVEQGCFTDQDIDVTISRGYGAADAVTKVATGVADFSVTDLGVIIGTIAESGTRRVSASPSPGSRYSPSSAPRPLPNRSLVILQLLPLRPA